MRTTLKLLFSMFPLRRCKTIRKRERPCLNYQMGRCLAPCADLVDNREYMAMVREVILLLEGKNRHIITKLQEKMHQAAADLAFEEAAVLRDRITALERTLEHQVIAAEHGLDQDIFGLARHGASVGIALLFVRAGMISGSQNFFIADPIGNDAQILSQTLMLYYSNSRHPPRELMLPLVIEDESLVREQLSELREGPVRLSVPRRGKRMQLMRMAAANAEQVFSKESQKLKAWQIMAKTLVHKLRLRNAPDHIECLDISNLSGKQAVGSLVCFIQGEPEKRGYRHYKINGKDEPDDYAMMREVLQRRMETGLAKNNLPDMLLLDGGKGQLGIGVEVLADFDLLDRIDLVAIAKEKQDEGEKLFRPGRKNPIVLPAHAPALLYLMRIRDESHRFGITFHRRLRRKNTLRSPLDRVTGIGAQRKKALLRTLGSYKRIQSATAEELATAPGIGPVLAKSIFRQLHPEDEKHHAA